MIFTPKKKKTSLWSRLSGGFQMFPSKDADYDEDDAPTLLMDDEAERLHDHDFESEDEDSLDGELGVDVYETPSAFIVKTIIAGVDKDSVEIAVSRQSITIRGARENYHSDGSGKYLTQELYWGAFSRTVALPEEVDIEAAEAHEAKGMLTIKLPKLDKAKRINLKVKN